MDAGNSQKNEHSSRIEDLIDGLHIFISDLFTSIFLMVTYKGGSQIVNRKNGRSDSGFERPYTFLFIGICAIEVIAGRVYSFWDKGANFRGMELSFDIASFGYAFNSFALNVIPAFIVVAFSIIFIQKICLIRGRLKKELLRKILSYQIGYILIVLSLLPPLFLIAGFQSMYLDFDPSDASRLQIDLEYELIIFWLSSVCIGLLAIHLLTQPFFFISKSLNSNVFKNCKFRTFTSKNARKLWVLIFLVLILTFIISNAVFSFFVTREDDVISVQLVQVTTIKSSERYDIDLAFTNNLSKTVFIKPGSPSGPINIARQFLNRTKEIWEPHTAYILEHYIPNESEKSEILPNLKQIYIELKPGVVKILKVRVEKKHGNNENWPRNFVDMSNSITDYEISIDLFVPGTGDSNVSTFIEASG
jgi:hypothetical protein